LKITRTGIGRSVIKLEGNRETNHNTDTGAIEFWNYNSQATNHDQNAIFGKIFTRKESANGANNTGKMRFAVSSGGNASSLVAFELKSNGDGKFFANLDVTGFVTAVDYTFSLNAGGDTSTVKDLYDTVSNNTTNITTNAQSIVNTIFKLNDLSSNFYTANIPNFHDNIDSATDGQYLRVNTESGNKVVKYEDLNTASSTDIGGIKINGNGLSIDSSTGVASIDLNAYTTSSSISITSSDRISLTTGSNKPLIINTGTASLMQQGSMAVLSDSSTDNGGTYVDLLLSGLSDGHDAKFSIRGYRNGSTSTKQAEISLENFDSNVSTSLQPDYIGKLGIIAGEVTNATTNVGDMVFYSSSDGVATTETMRIKSDNTLNITSELERPTDGYMTEVGTYLKTTDDIGGNNGIRYIGWNNSTTTGGLTHTGSNIIPDGSLWTKTTDGQGHYRINVVLGGDGLQGSTRYVFAIYVYTYKNASSTTARGDDKQQYFIGNGYARALSGTNQFRFGGNIDIYLNKDDQFEIVVEKLYGATNKTAYLDQSDTQLIVERIH
jgi:hypothetical protein